MQEYRKIEIGLEEGFSVPLPSESALLPSEIQISAPQRLFSNATGAIYMIFKPKEVLTVSSPNPECSTIVIEIKSSEINEIFEPRSLLIEILKERGVEEPTAEKMQQLLMEYVEKRAQERQLKLTDDVKKALVNLMVLIAKKLEEA
jgi:hypothetical protein